jgi:predicted dinucleotide-binding enzyme
MKIGIIGAGHIGGTAARLFVDAGHEIAISNSRGPETLRDLVAELRPNARAATPEEVASFGEIVLLAIPLKGYTTLPDLGGKIVIDAMNYYPGRSVKLGGPAETVELKFLDRQRVRHQFVVHTM